MNAQSRIVGKALPYDRHVGGYWGCCRSQKLCNAHFAGMFHHIRACAPSPLSRPASDRFCVPPTVPMMRMKKGREGLEGGKAGRGADGREAG